MITIIGASCIDIICQNVSKDVFDNGHEFASNTTMNYGGDGLNEAVVLAKLHKEVEFITSVGDDEFGKSIVKYCKSLGIKIKAAKKKQTYISTILVDKKGNRNLIGTHFGSLRELELNDIKKICGDIVCFGSMFISTSLKKKDYEQLFARIKNEGRILCSDTTTIKNNETVEEYKEVLNKLDYFFPNEKEAKLFTRTSSVKKAAELLHSVGVKNVVIKCGRKGCYLKNETYSEYITDKPCKTIDSTGAGDSFVAGFLKALSENKNIKQCCKYANKCGMLATQSIGATNWLKENYGTTRNFKGS